MPHVCIFGEMCHFWRNVPYLKNVSIFGGMCLLIIITPVIILTQIYKPDIYDTSPQVIRNLLFFLVNYLFFFCFSTYLGNYRGGVSPVPFLFEIPLHLDGNLLSSIIAVELKWLNIIGCSGLSSPRCKSPFDIWDIGANKDLRTTKANSEKGTDETPLAYLDRTFRPYDENEEINWKRVYSAHVLSPSWWLCSKLWNQVPSLDHFVVQNFQDFLCWKYKEVVCFYVSNLRQ